MASLGVVNGTGASNFNVVDNNNFKDVYVTADYELDSDGSIVGMYGYIGQAPMTGLMTISIKFRPYVQLFYFNLDINRTFIVRKKYKKCRC